MNGACHVRGGWGAHLEANLFDDSGLFHGRHAVLGDRGGGGVGHFKGRDGEGDGLVGFSRMNLLNRFLRVKLGG